MSIDADRSPRLLTVAEAAEYLKVSVPTVRRLVAQRQIPFLKVRGAIRFTSDDIGSYLENHRVCSIDQYKHL
jgi:excisionase family DNA binding protein